MSEVLNKSFIFFEPHVRSEARKRFDAPDSGGDAGVGDNLKKSDVTSHFGMGAPAQLDTDLRNGYDSHFLLILLAEESQRATCDGCVDVHNLGLDGKIVEDDVVDPLFNLD